METALLNHSIDPGIYAVSCQVSRSTVGCVSFSSVAMIINFSASLGVPILLGNERPINVTSNNCIRLSSNRLRLTTVLVVAWAMSDPGL